ncbi:MAG: PP2C family protein-serine/threonine phosphatase [Desulfococcaceae bacterium]
MRVRNKLKLLILLYAAIPLFFVALIGVQSPLMDDPDFQKALALGGAVWLFLVLSNQWFGMQWLMLRQVRKIRNFCAAVRAGNYLLIRLPNEPADPTAENELDALMRDMNWMANQIKIRERELKQTVESLESANRELAEANRRIAEVRDALWGEMALAKKIQTALIPNRPHIPGFDFSASLSPAQEVGGDYFDVFAVEGRQWLAIGDVSGHGVPAGLIMMMAQTAVHAALRRDPEMDPAVLLSVVNETLTENIRRLGESKYMTLTVMESLENGEFRFAGLHQDLLIYRALDGSVDEVETRGAWVGLMEDIRDISPVDHLLLEPGDVLLLFSDGVTEAVGPSGEMFGQDRLVAVLREAGGGSAAEIRCAVEDAISDHVRDDDVTLLVCKRELNGGVSRECVDPPAHGKAVNG